MGCIAKNGESIQEQVRDMGFDETEFDKPERCEENGKFGFICPRCKAKCWTMPVGEGWICECVDCSILFDED